MDHIKRQRRRGNAPLQKSCTTRGNRTIHGRQQRPGLTTAEGLGQFKVPARGHVDLHGAAKGFAMGRAQEGQLAFLGDL